MLRPALRCIVGEELGGGGGGGITLYRLYRYVPPQRVWFLSLLAENGYRF